MLQKWNFENEKLFKSFCLVLREVNFIITCQLLLMGAGGFGAAAMKVIFNGNVICKWLIKTAWSP